MKKAEMVGDDVFCDACGEPWSVYEREGSEIRLGYRLSCPACEGEDRVELLAALRQLIEMVELSGHARGVGNALAVARRAVRETEEKIAKLNPLDRAS